MGVDTTRYSFEQLLSRIVDNRGKTCPVSDDGIPLIATNCVKNETLYPVFEKVRYVDQETYENWFRGHPEPGDLIFVTKGSPGNVCLTPDPVNFCIAQDMVAIRANREIVDPKYLFALLRSPAAQDSIMNMHVGTLIPHFKKGDFKNLYFEIPDDLDLQKSIGEVYLELCEKIELNRQINTTLESMAQALFKSWFVDFDPVIDNALAAGNPIPDELQARADKRAGLHVWTSDEDARRASATEGASQKRKALHHQTGRTDQTAPLQPLPADNRALFPDSFVFNEEMGWVPEGWSIGILSDLCDVRKGLSYKGDFLSDNPDDLPLINLGNFGGAGKFRPEKIKYYSGEYRDKHLTKSGQLMIANTDMTQDRIILGSPLIVPPFTKGRVLFTHHTFAVDFQGVYETEGWKRYVYFVTLQRWFRERAEGFATGTTVLAMPREALLNCPILLPEGDVIERFKNMVAPMFERQGIAAHESDSLSAIRDSLLPKLLSGEMLAPDAEQTAEKAL